MADVAFTCPQCGHTYQFAAHLAGKRGRCKTCQAVFRIPAPAPIVYGPGTVTVVKAPTSSAPPPRSSRPGGDAKVVFNCPTCGHGYRLDAKQAGKQGRCTTCRGVFTIPAQSSPAVAVPSPSSQRRPAEAERPPRLVATDPVPARGPTRPDPGRSRPPAARGPADRPPVPSVPASGDSGWWELDSSESIPAATAPAAASRSRTATAMATSAPAQWTAVDDDDDLPIVTATPVRPRWATFAAIAAGTIVGGIVFAVTYSLILSALRPASPPVAGQPTDAPATPTPAPTPTPVVADTEGEVSSPPPSPQPSGAADRHREAVVAVIRAYNEIADGYARIRDPGSIAAGNASISSGVAQLRSASGRGKGLPPLSPPERLALIRQNGPALLQAVDRVLGELRRLQATPGLRSNFDDLIAAYTRTRQEIQFEVDQP